MRGRKVYLCLSVMALVMGAGMPGLAATFYSNDFNNPSDPDPATAWPELVDESTGQVEAVNGRIEWTGTGNHWLRLDKELPKEYAIEFDFFYEEGISGRFSLWPLVGPGISAVADRYHYFLRKNTHYYNGSDTVPTEGPRDLTLPLSAVNTPHRMRAEINGDHCILLYKDKGQGAFIKIDERDLQPFGEEPRYVQFGYNLDNNPPGLIFVDNFIITIKSENVFTYENNFNNPNDPDPATAWPEFVDESTGQVEAVNGRIEWTGTGNHWLRLDKELPKDYYIEFDFFYEEGISGRFSLWPLVGPGISAVADRYHYFLRKNTHYYNGSDTVPTEGPRDLTLPLSAVGTPHRIRAEISGDHCILLYKNKGQGAFIKIDERDLQPFGDEPRYMQFGYNLDNNPPGLIFVDNLLVKGLSANRVDIKRAFGDKNFTANKPLMVSLNATVSGAFPVLTVIDDYPDGWKASAISDGGVDANGVITWNLKNLTASKTLTYTVTPARLSKNRTEQFAGTLDSGDGPEPVGGDSVISVVLPYFYREAVDYDYTPNPKNGKKYPLGHEYGVLYCQGIDGKLGDEYYYRPGDGITKPAIDTVFNFTSGADFYYGGTTGTHGGVYDWTDYRNIGEIGLEHGASDTHNSIGGISAGDWFNYTFDFGTSNVVVLLNISFDTWAGTGSTYTDIYIDKKFKAEIISPRSVDNEFNFFTVGPFSLTGGEHTFTVAFPPDVGNTPTDIGRLEVVTTKGLGEVTRALPASGKYRFNVPFTVTLNAKATNGTYKPLILETIPPGTTASNISNSGVVDGNTIFWELSETTTSTSVTYDLIATAGDTLTFSGYADIGLPVAKVIGGNTKLTRDTTVSVPDWMLH